MTPSPTPTPTCGNLLCAVNTLAEQLTDPWPQFWLTALATLAGAVVGALAAWGFALDLRRRQEATEYEDRLNMAIADISTAVRAVVMTGRASLRKRLTLLNRHRIIVDYDRIATAIERARVIANTTDDRVFVALRDRFEAYFDILTWRGRIEHSLALLRDNGYDVHHWRDIKKYEGQMPSLATVSAAKAVWWSWQSDPFETIEILQGWRRGEMSADEAIPLLDPKQTPILRVNLTGPAAEEARHPGR